MGREPCCARARNDGNPGRLEFVANRHPMKRALRRPSLTAPSAPPLPRDQHDYGSPHGRLDLPHGRPDEGQARPHHGRRQRQVDRLGHRPAARRAGRRHRLHLSGRRTGAPGAPADRIDRHEHDDLGRRHRRRRDGRGVRAAEGQVRHHRLPRPLHRLCRQGRAAGLVGRQHHARRLPPRDGYLGLLLHRLRAPRL